MKRLRIVLWALLVYPSSALPAQEPPPEFECGFSGPALTGVAGAVQSGDYFCTLKHAGAGPGAQAWSLSLTAQNALITAVTTDGTDVPALSSKRYESMELTVGEGNVGAVIAEVLSLGKPVELPANATSVVAKLTVEATVPPEDSVATLLYVNGLVGSGQPVQNRITQSRVTVLPVLTPFEFTLRSLPDSDGDGVADGDDNCPTARNPDQGDMDGFGGGDVCDPCPADPSDECNTSKSTSASVPTEGGEVVVPDETVRVTVPPEALGVETSISATNLSGGISLETDQGPADPIVSVVLGPSGITFAVPVSVHLRWSDADGDGIVDGTDYPETSLSILKDGKVIAGPCGADPNCDVLGNTYVVQVTSFSQFSLAKIIGGHQRPGDCNQDGALDISDAICLLGFLFLGDPTRLPCAEGTAADAANRSLIDSNADEEVDLSDAVYVLTFLFAGGPPPSLGGACLPIVGCRSACAE